MVSIAGVTHSPPEILNGAPVFVGTRVPVRALFDYLEGGEPLADLPHQFPSVKREQTIAVLDAPLKGARRMQRLLVKDLTPMFRVQLRPGTLHSTCLGHFPSTPAGSTSKLSSKGL